MPGARSSTGAAPKGRFLIIMGILGVVLVLLGAMYLYDHSKRDQIAQGVRIDGLKVGGLSASAARIKVQKELASTLARRPVTVHSAQGSWRIVGKEASLNVNVDGMVAEAVGLSREGSIFSRTARGLFGGTVNRDIALQATYSHQAVRALTAKVRAAVNRPARDATVQPSATGLAPVPAKSGVRINSPLLGRKIERALTDASASASIGVPTQRLRPAVSTSELASKYPAYIIVDRGAFALRFYEHLKLVDTYPIAVGMQGLETPPGLYHIQWKQVDPPWYVPNSAWAGSLAGTVVPPGPEDPLKARFMSFDGGAGIHGIDPSEYGTIGHDASHGCVRMTIPDVIALYSRTPVGTPVYIA